MATNESYVMTTHNLPNYSGLLFNFGETRTPFSTLIGGKSRNANSWEFVTSQSYSTGGGTEQPAITETASLTAPTPSFVTRTQDSNACQIFHKAVTISYAKESANGQLSGLNIAGQEANPISELDFQIADKMAEMANDVEYTLINGVYQKGTYDDVAWKTNGIINAITSNVKAAGGAALSYWLIAELIAAVYEANVPTDNLTIMCQPVHIMQINADAASNGMTIVPAAMNVNGLKIDTLVTPFGSIGLLPSTKVPKGTAVLVNPAVCSPVYLDVPGKGNFFLEPLSKTGAAEAYQIYGQLGLDYGAEKMHARIDGLLTTFTAPTYSKVVKTVSE